MCKPRASHVQATCCFVEKEKKKKKQKGNNFFFVSRKAELMSLCIDLKLLQNWE